MMEASRGTAYGLGLSQVAITLGCVLFFQSVEVDVFIPRASLVVGANHTAIAMSSRAASVHMGMPVLCASGLAAMFAVVTFKAHEHNLSGQDFQPEVVEQMGMWDLLFWAYSLLAHGIVVLLVCDPVDVFGALSGTCFLGYFLFRACYPKGQAVNLTQENLNLLGYGLGVLQVVAQMTDTRGNGMSAVMLMVVVDYFLGIGHTYDRQATIDTVSNCRLFYICAGTMGTAVLYAVSGPEGEGGTDVFL
jgi:hypothetical protein